MNGAPNFELRDFERRLRANSGYFYSAKDIEASHANRLTDFLAMNPHVRLRGLAGGYSAQSPLGASEQCPSGVVVYLDGVPVNAGEGSDPARAQHALAPRTTTSGSRPGSTPTPAPAGTTPTGRGRAAAQASASAASRSVPDPISGSAALPPFDINAISVTQLAAMEVYPEGGPTAASRGPLSKCGVVLLWSKPK